MADETTTAAAPVAAPIYNDDEVASYKTSSLGYDLVFKGPKTVEIYDRRAGEAGAALKSACLNDVYRGTLPDWQDKFAKWLTERFGATRQVNQKATDAAKARAKTEEAKAKVKDVLETVTTFHNRIKATASEDDQKEMATKAQELANDTYIDPSPSARAAGIPKEYKTKAEAWLALPEDQLESKITKATDKVGGFDLVRDEEGKPAVESLARLVQAYINVMMEEMD